MLHFILDFAIESFTKHGANLDLKNGAGKTAYDVAIDFARFQNDGYIDPQVIKALEPIGKKKKRGLLGTIVFDPKRPETSTVKIKVSEYGQKGGFLVMADATAMRPALLGDESRLLEDSGVPVPATCGTVITTEPIAAQQCRSTESKHESEGMVSAISKFFSTLVGGKTEKKHQKGKANLVPVEERLQIIDEPKADSHASSVSQQVAQHAPEEATRGIDARQVTQGRQGDSNFFAPIL